MKKEFNIAWVISLVAMLCFMSGIMIGVAAQRGLTP